RRSRRMLTCAERDVEALENSQQFAATRVVVPRRPEAGHLERGTRFFRVHGTKRQSVRDAGARREAAHPNRVHFWIQWRWIRPHRVLECSMKRIADNVPFFGIYRFFFDSKRRTDSAFVVLVVQKSLSKGGRVGGIGRV